MAIVVRLLVLAAVAVFFLPLEGCHGTPEAPPEAMRLPERINPECRCDCTIMNEGFLAKWLQSAQEDIDVQRALLRCDDSTRAANDSVAHAREFFCSWLDSEGRQLRRAVRAMHGPDSLLWRTYHGDLVTVMKHLLSILKRSCTEAYIIETHANCDPQCYDAYLILRDSTTSSLYDFRGGGVGWVFLGARQCDTRSVENIFQLGFQPTGCDGRLSGRYMSMRLTRIRNDSIATKFLLSMCEELSETVYGVVNRYGRTE